ncbi:hypothetical protein ACFTZ8_26740 [Streptomyces fungicidicus]|uniref:hypothetical protein n=1 Tax=Streptomyces fungicidicus TaxID=68203 RepID=UPI003625343C
MARIIYTVNTALTDGQITALYELSEKSRVVIGLWRNTPSPARDSFIWSISGGLLRVLRFRRILRALG